MNSENEPLLLTVQQAARRLQLGTNRIYGLCNAGILPCIKIGNTFRIPTAALEKWVAENIVKPEKP